MSKKLDISKLAARLEELNKPRGGGDGESGTGVSYVQINPGDNVIRLLPGKEDPLDFAVEAWVHYGVGKKGDDKGKFVICPKTNNESAYCPQCELSNEYFKLSKKKDDKYSKLAKDANKKKRVYFNAIDRAVDLSKLVKDGDGVWKNADDERETPIKVLATGIGVYKDILALITNPDYGTDLIDPEDGLDIVINKSGSGQFNTEYKVTARRKNSPLGFDGDWEDELNDLKALAKPSTADEISALLGVVPEDSAGDSGPTDISDPDHDEPDTDTGKETDSADDEGLEDDIKAALQRRKNRG